MQEYTLTGINVGLDSSHSIVLCRILYDFTKACLINLKSGTNIVGNVTKSSEDHEKEESINKNLEATSGVTEEALTTIHGDRYVATKLQELDAFCGNFGFNDLGSESFCLGDLGDVGPSLDGMGDISDLGPCFDADRIMRCLNSDPQEGPVEDNSINNLGKRKFEAEKNSC